MYNKKYTAPYKPEISGPVDIRNFDTVNNSLKFYFYSFVFKGFTDEPI